MCLVNIFFLLSLPCLPIKACPDLADEQLTSPANSCAILRTKADRRVWSRGGLEQEVVIGVLVLKRQGSLKLLNVTVSAV